MPTPTRPVASAAIATDWGQAVHDDLFAPPGCHLRGAVASVGATVEQLPLETALSDPGGWSVPASHKAEVPTGRGGLYAVSCRVQADESDAVTRFYLYLNGAAVASQSTIGDGSNVVVETIVIFLELAAGDELTVWARRGTGADPDCRVADLWIVHVGRELGA